MSLRCSWERGSVFAKWVLMQEKATLSGEKALNATDRHGDPCRIQVDISTQECET